MLTHMEPENLSPLQLLLATRIRHRCGLRASSNNSHHTLVRQVNGLNSSHPPFTCLDENIKNMEVGSILSKCLERILLKIQTNMEPRDLSALDLSPSHELDRPCPQRGVQDLVEADHDVNVSGLNTLERTMCVTRQLAKQHWPPRAICIMVWGGPSSIAFPITKHFILTYRSPRRQVHLAGATVPHLPTNAASAHTFLFDGPIAVPRGGT